MKTTTLLTLCTVTLFGLTAGCSTETATAEGSTVDDLTSGGSNASITEADIYEAETLKSMFVPNPALGAGATAKVIDSSEFDGTRSSTVLVKDGDGRLFRVYNVDSAPTQAEQTHGSAPSFADSRYFLLLNAAGVKWATETFPTVPSTRHAQILESMASPHFADDVTNLGTTAAGATLLHFNASLFVVAEGGMENRCASESSNCSSLWQRVNNAVDPFDAR